MNEYDANFKIHRTTCLELVVPPSLLFPTGGQFGLRDV